MLLTCPDETSGSRPRLDIRLRLARPASAQIPGPRLVHRARPSAGRRPRSHQRPHSCNVHSIADVRVIPLPASCPPEPRLCSPEPLPLQPTETAVLQLLLAKASPSCSRRSISLNLKHNKHTGLLLLHHLAPWSLRGPQPGVFLVGAYRCSPCAHHMCADSQLRACADPPGRHDAVTSRVFPR